MVKHVLRSRMMARLRAPCPAAAVWMLLSAAFLWGSGNVANKTMMDDIDPWSAVLLRSLVAAAALLPLAVGELRGGASWRWMQSCALPSLMFTVALALQQAGYQTATVTNASFLVNAATVLTPILAFFVLREKLSPAILIAAPTMLVGAFVMSGAHTSLQDMNRGDALCLLSAIAYAAWAVAICRHAMRHAKPVATTLMHSCFAAALSLPFAGTVWSADLPSLVAAAPEVFYVGVFSTAVAFFLMISAQSRVSPSVAVVLTSAESLFGAAGGVLILGEVPSATTILGAVLMLASIAVVAVSTARPTRSDPARIGASG